MSSNRKKSIIVASPNTPQTDTSAGDRRFAALLEMLAKQHSVDLCVLHPTQPQNEGKDRNRFAAMGVHLLPYRNFFADPVSVALSRRPYDLAFFEFYTTAWERMAEFRRYNPTAKTVVDTVDIHFFREAAGVALGVGSELQARENKGREISVYETSDALILVSPLDMELLKEEIAVPVAQEVLPIIMPIRPRGSEPRKDEVVFVGGFNHDPNTDGITWFVEDIWGKVRAEVPNAHLSIIGSNAPSRVKELSGHPGVTVVGYVAQTEPFLDQASVSVAPLRFGAGMKGKVCEAMACGIPVVTTSIGAQGLFAQDGEHLLLAETPDDFARAVVTLLQEPERAAAIGHSGQQLISKICSPISIEDRLNNLICGLIQSSEEPGWMWKVHAAKLITKSLLQRSKHNIRYALSPK